MATADVLTEREQANNFPGSHSQHPEDLADRVTTITAMVGGILGVIAGALLGNSLDAIGPCVFGTLGAVLGSILSVVVGQYVFPRSWINRDWERV